MIDCAGHKRIQEIKIAGADASGEFQLASEAAEQNNRAFCDKSIKFGTEVDNSLTMKY